MGRDPGAPDDKGKNKDLPLIDEIPFMIGRGSRDLKMKICLSGSSSPGPSNNISGVPKCDIEQKVQWREILKEECLQQEELQQEKLYQEALKKFFEKLFGESECFVRGTSSAMGKGIWGFLHQRNMERLLHQGLDMCMTCKRLFHSERFCSCQHKLMPITAKARPRRHASSEGTITMDKPRSSGEVNGFARENGVIKTGPGPTLLPLSPVLIMPITSDEIKSEPSQASDSSSSHVFAGKDGDIEMGLGHTVRPLVPNVSDETTSEPSQASDSFSSHGFAGNDSGIEMVLGHTPCHPAPIPTMLNVSDETTLEPSQASDSSPSHDFAPTDSDIERGRTHSSDLDSDIERGRTHSSDLVPIEPSLGDPCSYHNAYEPNSQRLANPLLAEITQIACALVAFKTSDGSSPAKDVLFYLLVFICVLGFLYTLAGKWFHCAKMAVIGLVATALGFLMTMALVVLYKIR